ncbi:MAG: EamA family transporter [Kluyvera ascorbata]
MSALMYLILLFCVFGLAVGNLLLKKTASTIQVIPQDIFSLVFNPWFYYAVIVYGGSTLLWVMILRKIPLGLAYPMFALGFIIVPILDYFIFKEPLRVTTLIGGVVIIFGVMIATRG